jgi:hypothetical protein
MGEIKREWKNKTEPPRNRGAMDQAKAENKNELPAISTE